MWSPKSDFVSREPVWLCSTPVVITGHVIQHTSTQGSLNLSQSCYFLLSKLQGSLSLKIGYIHAYMTRVPLRMPQNSVCSLSSSYIFVSGRGRGGSPFSASRKGNIQEYKGTKISFDE